MNSVPDQHHPSAHRRPHSSLIVAAAWVTVLFLHMSLPGCGLTGHVYKHVIKPLDTNLSGDPITEPLSVIRRNRLDTRRITVNALDFEWGDRGIGTIAEEWGLEVVYYADVELLSVLGGVWKQQWVHIYGR